MWAACLYLLYASLILFPSEIWTTYFLMAGALAVVGRMTGLWDRVRPKGSQAPGPRPGLPALASDLAFLIALQQGFIQAKVESGRGNILGIFLCLAFVTPLLALLTRALVLKAGNKLAAKRWKSGRNPVLPPHHMVSDLLRHRGRQPGEFR